MYSIAYFRPSSLYFSELAEGVTKPEQFQRVVLKYAVSFPNRHLEYWNCSSLVPPSASSEKYKELGLKYAIEYAIYVRDPLLANPALYFGVDSMNIVRCVKRGMVRTSINY